MLKYLLVGIHVISSIPKLHLLLVKCNPSLFLPSFFVLETYIQFVGVGMRNSPLQCGRLNCRSETGRRPTSGFYALEFFCQFGRREFCALFWPAFQKAFSE